MSSRRILPAVALAAAVLALAGCGDSPPDCSSGEVQARIREWYTSAVPERVTDYVGRGGHFADPKRGPLLKAAIESYGTEMKVALKDVATEGYSKEARKYGCSADFALTTNPDNEHHLRVSYAVQATDEKDKFLLLIPPRQQQVLISVGASDFDWYQEKRLGADAIK